MKFVVWIMVTVVILLLVGVLPAGESPPDAVFRSPVLIALLAVVAVSSLVCCALLLFKKGPKLPLGLKRVGFLLTHVSVTIILAGAFLKYAVGKEGTFILPVLPDHSVSTSYDGKLHLDFELGATQLEILYYEPDHYDLFVLPPGTNSQNEAHEFSGRIDVPTEGPLIVDEDTRIPLSEMKDSENKWKAFYVLPDASILQVSRTARCYSAMLHFMNGDGRVFDRKIEVNHPVTFHKWRFYLMSAKEGQPYIVLSGRKDPGWFLVRAGIWMLLAGVAIMCFRRTRVV